MGRAEVTPDALRVFASLIDDLGKIDRESTSEADRLRNLAVAHIMLAIEGRSLTIYPLLQQVFAFALDWPQERRRKLSPRLDLSGAQTYADVAKVAYRQSHTSSAEFLLGEQRRICLAAPLGSALGVDASCVS